MTKTVPIDTTQFVLYTSPTGDIKLEVRIKNETIWLSQDKIAQLFGVDRSVITKHLKNIYSSQELDQTTTSAKIAQHLEDGRIYQTTHYNLDAIIAVGYRANSQRATQFRIWSTQVIREYIIKGFAMNDERLKQGSQVFGQDYFKELLERVRSIRASERRIYQQITDIFAECSNDYDQNSEVTKDFFATIQNKFHFAITGHTAAEIIAERADSTKQHMGLTTWKYSPSGRVIQSDVIVAENYLPEDQIKKLERTVSGFFDYIENLIENRQSFTMTEFSESVNKFLTFNEYKVLSGKGTVSKKEAERKAIAEYNQFNKTQPIESDFDKLVKQLKNDNN